MRAYDLHCKSEKFADLDLPVSAFYLLAAPSTPDKALEEVAMRVGKGNGVSVAEVKDIIAKSRRGSSLRHLIHVARQTLRDLIKRGLPNNFDEWLERHLGDLDRDQVRAIIHQKCAETLERREVQLLDLKSEIEHLKKIKSWSDGPLWFTPCPNQRGPCFPAAFYVGSQPVEGATE